MASTNRAVDEVFPPYQAPEDHKKCGEGDGDDGDAQADIEDRRLIDIIKGNCRGHHGIKGRCEKEGGSRSS